jgi:ABC-2 type transport system permease protein
LSLVAELRDSRELLGNLALREIRGKYKRTVLGQAWSLVNPLAQMLIYTLVFSFIFRIQPAPGDPSGLDYFALWLMCGLLPWTFFVGVMTGGMTSLVDNAPLILKVWFPRYVLPASVMIAGLVTFGFELLVLLVALIIAGGMPLPYLPILVLAMLLLGLVGFGLALLLSVANVYFRDTQHFVSIAVQVWFYLTPIIYPASLVTDQIEAGGYPTWWIGVYEANPMVAFVNIFRALLYDNRIPDGADVLLAVGATVVSLLVGATVFRRRQDVLAEEL